MKKLITITLCAVMALSITACFNDKSEAKTDPQMQTNHVEIPNPWVDCENIADAEKLAGFTATLPKTIPDGYTQKSIEAVKNNTVQIIYENGENKIVFRQARGNDDVSGDYNEYKVNLATWVSGGFSFAISVNPGGKGLDNQAINDMISSMDINNA
ncbi:hypothetical protein [Lacrimispora sp.]|uniref:hypothetical protein n=1 Tax=Lacrimispora sp. TaxID=2719234 RepID=UPI0028AB5D88|nr:hypothetical protein [Lacrimispora sp.]